MRLLDQGKEPARFSRDNRLKFPFFCGTANAGLVDGYGFDISFTRFREVRCEFPP
jgi:hypothetical protein